MTRFAHLARRRHDQRGAAAVEFALILPLLVLLVFGIVQFSIYFNRMQGLHAAAREGARIGALPQSSQTEIRDKVTSALAGVLPSSASPSITISPSSGNPCDLKPPGSKVTVTVSAPTDIDIPLFGAKTVTVTGKGEFKCE